MRETGSYPPTPSRRPRRSPRRCPRRPRAAPADRSHERPLPCQVRLAPPVLGVTDLPTPGRRPPRPPADRDPHSPERAPGRAARRRSGARRAHRAHQAGPTRHPSTVARMLGYPVVASLVAVAVGLVLVDVIQPDVGAGTTESPTILGRFIRSPARRVTCTPARRRLVWDAVPAVRSRSQGGAVAGDGPCPTRNTAKRRRPC